MLGPPLLFPAFAAVFLGATQFNFRPNVWGTLLAIFTLALGVQGLQLASTSGQYWISSMFNGVALLIAVVFSRRQHSPRRKRGGSEDPDTPVGGGTGDHIYDAAQEPAPSMSTTGTTDRSDTPRGSVAQLQKGQ